MPIKTIHKSPKTINPMTENMNKFRASFAFARTNSSSYPVVFRSTSGMIRLANGITYPIRNDQ